MKMKRNVLFIITLCAFASLNASAAVVQRSGTPSRATTTSRMPTAAKAVTATTTETATSGANITDETTETVADEIIIEDKSSQFSATLGKELSNNSDSAGNDLAELIRSQRNALDMADVAAANAAANTSGKSSCDAGLRSCMTEKCGTNFIKCASDTDTIFGTKLDACRRDLNCTAKAFKLLSAEIKADRDAAIKLKSFNDIIDCGQSYDSCIVRECGATYSMCLGKSAGDVAISKCATIAKNCASMDSGLANRTMNVFATLRQTAEKQISADEKKLYALRDQMKTVCSRLGAMFDERSLDCVYTVNFYAGGDSTLYASKKAYAGATFDCTPNWFGVDVTTFKENAYRLTREQSSASSAMLGSGVGMAVGAVTSGAINRAIDRKTAEDAVKKAKCENCGGTWNSFLGTCSGGNDCPNATDNKPETTTEQPDNNSGQQEQAN